MIVSFQADAHLKRDESGWVDGKHAHCANALPPPEKSGQWLRNSESDIAWVWAANEKTELWRLWVEDYEPGFAPKDARFRSAAGVAGKSEVTHTDFPAAHDSHDFISYLEVDEEDEHLLSYANHPNEEGNVETTGNLDPPEAIELEWETGTHPSEREDSSNEYFPRAFWPSKGDRVWTNGHFIFDCGHGIEIDSAEEDSSLIADPHYKPTEIHPPRAIATMRNQADELPGTGATPVNVTTTDLYIHGEAGFVTQILYCTPHVMYQFHPARKLAPNDFPEECRSPLGHPHKGSPIDVDYEFNVCLPPRPSPQAILVAEVDEAERNGDHLSEAQVPLDIEAVEASDRCDNAAPGVSYDKGTMLNVTVPLDGTDAEPQDVYSREIVAGWVSPPDPPLDRFQMEATGMWLWEDIEPPGDDDCECTFFWANVNQAQEEWIRLADYATEPENEDSANPEGNMNDFEANQACVAESCYKKEHGYIPFEDAVFEFHARRSAPLTVQAGGWDQDCMDGWYGHHFRPTDPIAHCYADIAEVGIGTPALAHALNNPGGGDTYKNDRLPHLSLHLTEKAPVPPMVELGGQGWGEGFHGASVAYGDVDGDSHDELGVTRYANNGMRFQIREDGRGVHASEKLYDGGLDWPSQAWATSIDFGDIDGDDNDEIGVTVGGAHDGSPRFFLYDDAWAGYQRLFPPVDDTPPIPDLVGGLPDMGGRPWGDGVNGISIAFGDVDEDDEEEIGVARDAANNTRFLVLDDLNAGFAPLLPSDMYADEDEDKDETLAGRNWGDKSEGGGGWSATSIAFGDGDGDGYDEIGVTRALNEGEGFNDNDENKNMRYRIYDDAEAARAFNGIHTGGEGWGETWAESIAFGDVDDDPAEEFAVALNSVDDVGLIVHDDNETGDFNRIHVEGDELSAESTNAFGDRIDWEDHDADALSVAFGDLEADGLDEIAFVVREKGTVSNGDLKLFILNRPKASWNFEFGAQATLGEAWGQDAPGSHRFPHAVAVGEVPPGERGNFSVLCGIEVCGDGAGKYYMGEIREDTGALRSLEEPDSRNEEYALRFSMEEMPSGEEDDVEIGKEKECIRRENRENNEEDLTVLVYQCWINATNEGPGIPRGVTVYDQLDDGLSIDPDLPGITDPEVPGPKFNITLEEDQETAFEADEKLHAFPGKEGPFPCSEFGSYTADEIVDEFECELDTIPAGGKATITYLARFSLEAVQSIDVVPQVVNTITVCTDSNDQVCSDPVTIGIPMETGDPAEDELDITFESPTYEWTNSPRVDTRSLLDHLEDRGGHGGASGVDSFSFTSQRLNGGPSDGEASAGEIIPIEVGPTELDTGGSGVFEVVAQPLEDGAPLGTPVGITVGVDRSPPSPFDIHILDTTVHEATDLPTLEKRSTKVAWETPSDVGTGVSSYRYALDGERPTQIPDPRGEAVTGELDDLADGVHRFEVTAIDGAGNERSASVDFCVQTRADTSCGKRGLLERGLEFPAGSEEHLMLVELPSLVGEELGDRGQIPCRTMGTCSMPRAQSLMDGTVHVLVEGEKGTYAYGVEMDAGTITGFEVLDDPSRLGGEEADTHVTTTVQTVRNAKNSEEPRYAVMQALATGNLDVDPDGLTDSVLVEAGQLATRALDRFGDDLFDLDAGETRSYSIDGRSGELRATGQGYNVFSSDDGAAPVVVDSTGTQVGQTTQEIQRLAAEPMPGSDWSLSENAGVLDSGTLDREDGGWP